jgi:tRNA threonylcarbamoyladenosine biosynthesis protein TsaB
MILSEAHSNSAHFPGRILAMDTSTASMSIAIIENGQLVQESHIHAERNHSLHLMPMIQELLQSTGMKLADLTGLAVGVGPGSYTGVRIGVTAAKTLAWTLKLPLIGVSSLEAMALGAALFNNAAQAQLPAWIVPLMDARRSQVYTGLYSAHSGAIAKKRLQDHEEARAQYLNIDGLNWHCMAADGIRLLERWLEQLVKTAPERITFVGELSNLKQQLEHFKEMSPVEVIFSEYDVQAFHIGLIASLRFAAGVRADVHQLIPNYTQLTEAEANLLAKPH